MLQNKGKDLFKLRAKKALSAGKTLTRKGKDLGYIQGERSCD